MKAIFIHFFDFASYSGVSKKINSQVEALIQNGVDTELCYINIDKDGRQRRVCGKSVIDDFGNGLFAKIYKWFRFSNLTKYILSNNFDMVYIRSFYNVNPPMLKMLKKVHNAGIRIVMEYPTYPYDIETRNQPLNYSFIFLLNRIYRKQLYKYVDRIVTFTDLEKIHGIKTIHISNGVDFCTLPLKSKKEKSNTINLISVAEIHYWHGLDRVINGLSKYYDKDKPSSTEVNLTIVGGGDKRLIDSLIKLTINLKLQDHVRFVGYKSGEELDRLFEEADFGIASLARHRSGISKIKTLKNREYAARGLPFIYSEDDEDFDNMPYIIKAPPDESPINIESLVEFYKTLNITPEEIRNTIISTLSWTTQMKKIIDTINNFN